METNDFLLKVLRFAWVIGILTGIFFRLRDQVLSKIASEDNSTQGPGSFDQITKESGSREEPDARHSDIVDEIIVLTTYAVFSIGFPPKIHSHQEANRLRWPK